MASILIFPAFFVLAVLLFLWTRHWLVLVCVALVFCLIACGLCFWEFEFAWPASLSTALPAYGVSPGGGLHKAGFFGPLSDVRVIGLGLAAVIVVWLLNTWSNSSRGDSFQWDRLQGLITMGVLAAVAWVIFNYRF